MFPHDTVENRRSRKDELMLSRVVSMSLQLLISIALGREQF